MNWSIKRRSAFGLATIGLLVGFVGIWGTFTSLAGAVIASGQIEPRSRNQVVQHPDGGTVARIFVEDGDRVAEGEVLLELDGSALRSQQAIVKTQLAELAGEIARLKTEQIGGARVSFPDNFLVRSKVEPAVAEIARRQSAIFDTRLSTLRETVRGLREQQDQKQNEIDGFHARVHSLTDQLSVLQTELSQARSLQDKGLMQASRVFELQRAAMSMTGDIAGSNASAAAAGSEVARLNVEIQRLAAARQEEIAGSLGVAENKFRELDEQESDLSRRVGRLSLRAPRSGIIHGLQIHALGAVIKPADPVVYVVPQDDQLTVTARVDAYHVDAIYTGQRAMMRFTSFDARLTPEVAGTVQRISPDTTTDSRTGATFYTVEIVMDADDSRRLGGKVLLPGMPVEVYIQTESRSPIRYILKPFLDFVERAGKE